jgi:hypothetical protein
MFGKTWPPSAADQSAARAVEVLLTKVVNRQPSVLPIVAFF